MKTAVFVTIFSVVGLFIFARPAAAQVLSWQQLRLDTTITLSDNAFSVPTQILLTPIFLPEKAANVTERDWFRGLYYYSVANSHRAGFTDIPFHYVVSHSGEIYKGNAGGDERKISVEGVGSDVIVIGYLAGRNDNSFDSRAYTALTELLLDVANRNSIKPDKIVVSGIQLVKNVEQQVISLAKADVFGLWNTSLNEVIESVKRLYSPVAKTYAVQVTNVEMPQEEVKPGDTVTAAITIKNIGEFGIYPDTLSELVGTKREGNSKFRAADGWVSTSQFQLTAADPVLLPGKEQRFEFKLYVPLFFGVQTEGFHLRNIAGQTISGTEFDVTLNVGRLAGVTIVEVSNTETGWLRVRATPSSAAAEITRISTGERYYQLEEQSNGWVKIKLNDGREGWVSKQYLRYP